MAGARAQCTDHTITVGGGTWDFEITWELVDDQGAIVANGSAPAVETECLPDGCYTMYLYDSFGDGWNGATWTITETLTGITVGSGTLNSGAFGTAQVSLGGGCGGGGPCDNYTLTVTAGTWPSEISWNLVGGTNIIATGFAPTTVPLCLDTGCYTMQLFDSFGDGWNGATWTLTNSLGGVVQTGTLATGSIGSANIPLGVPATNCANTGPVTASDCADAVNICTNYSFSIDPNGIGSLNEIPPLGSLGNPDLLGGDAVMSAWGTDNWGCLRNNELNSTWMVINVSVGGVLEFTFGGLGTQAGFYDWIMYPYGPGTCSSIMANTLPPIRCNWNAVSFGGTGLAGTVPPGGNAGNFEPPLTVAAGDQYIVCFSNWSSVTTIVPLEFGGTAVVSCDPVVLPVELVSFGGTSAPGGVQLSWTTASEEGTARFEVERSTDLWTWGTIGSVAAAGNSQALREYSLLDPRPMAGENYYRLRMVDLDGSEAYSPIAGVVWHDPGPAVRPNPSSGTIWVRTQGAAPEVVDALGRLVPVLHVAAGGNETGLHIPRSGVFTVRWQEGGVVRSERVLVR